MNKAFAPHLRAPRATRDIMLDVCLALLPALGAAIWRFGTRALAVTLPLWMIPIGALVAIVVVKELFGGIGQTFSNPAVTARIVLMLSFPVQMTAWNLPIGHSWGTDAIATATPLQTLSADAVASATPSSAAEALPGLKSARGRQLLPREGAPASGG